MQTHARRVVLPQYTVTEIAEADDPNAIEVHLPDGLIYRIRPKRADSETSRIDGKARWKLSDFRTYPIILKGDGSPWDEANLFVFDKIEQRLEPKMSTFNGNADDLTDFRRFLEEEGLDWTSFPRKRLAMPTYRYRGELQQRVNDHVLKASTANRRLGVMVAFYRHAFAKKMVEKPDNPPPWKEWVAYIPGTNAHGRETVMTVMATDMKVKGGDEHEDFSTTIDDGGKLRPLLANEQQWLYEALEANGNTEVTLAHALSWHSGARIQNVLTMRVKHFMGTFRMPDGQTANPERLISAVHAVTGSQLPGVWLSGREVMVNVGPKWGADTKGGRNATLHIPLSVYEDLQSYALCKRARSRRLLAIGGDVDDQYLFLTEHGAPWYLSEADARTGMFGDLRYAPRGQALRKYIATYIIPYVRQRHDPNFSYRFHDMRATYGMNLVDYYLQPLMELNDDHPAKITVTQAIDFVSKRMWHSSLQTTERYFRYRKKLNQLRALQDNWESHLLSLSRRAMESVA